MAKQTAANNVTLRNIKAVANHLIFREASRLANKKEIEKGTVVAAWYTAVQMVKAELVVPTVFWLSQDHGRDADTIRDAFCTR
jgi:hypothetical protein